MHSLPRARLGVAATCLGANLLAACGGHEPEPAVTPVAIAPPIAGTGGPPELVAPRPRLDRSKRRPSFGDESAPLEIVEFGDLECPHCRAGLVETTQLATTHPGTLRITWRHYPLTPHPHAQAAAEAAEGVYQLAGDQAFFRFALSALSHQKELTPLSFDDWAKEAGLRDLGAFHHGLASHTWLPQVMADKAEGERLKLTYVPSLYFQETLLPEPDLAPMVQCVATNHARCGCPLQPPCPAP